MDEQVRLCPPDAPPNEESGVDPPKYRMEMNQSTNTNVVYVQAPLQAPLQPAEAGIPANDYLVLSIITLLCCFWPIGLVALFKSVEVRRHNGEGRYEDARKASKDAFLFNKLGIIIGSISFAMSLIFTVAAVIYVVVTVTSSPYG